MKLILRTSAYGWPLTRPIVLSSLAVLLVVRLVGGFSAGTVQARTSQTVDKGRKTVWDGVYTADQATRGMAAYQTKCSRCHNEDLTGKDTARPLKGERFMQDWGEDNLSSLFNHMKNFMPQNAPSSLSDDIYLDIVAYVLQANAFPAGAEELKADVLESIWVVSKEGPGLIPDGALVQVVGCLTQGPDKTWILMNTSEPVRTRNPAASKPTELKNAEAKPLGTLTFRLLDVYPSPDSHTGHKMEVKGFLIRVPNDDGINVTSLQMVASSCET